MRGLARLAAVRGGVATGADGSPAGAPAAAHCRGEDDEARSSRGAAWYGEHDGVAGSGGGRLETRNRGAAGARPWRTSWQRAQGGAERGRERRRVSSEEHGVSRSGSAFTTCEEEAGTGVGHGGAQTLHVRHVRTRVAH
jgi:hypothetical protein